MRFNCQNKVKNMVLAIMLCYPCIKSWNEIFCKNCPIIFVLNVSIYDCCFGIWGSKFPGNATPLNSEGNLLLKIFIFSKRKTYLFSMPTSSQKEIEQKQIRPFVKQVKVWNLNMVDIFSFDFSHLENSMKLQLELWAY